MLPISNTKPWLQHTAVIQGRTESLQYYLVDIKYFIIRSDINARY